MHNISIGKLAQKARPGDILAFTSYDWLGIGINVLTRGIKCCKFGFCHVALIEDDTYYHDDFPRLQGIMIYESTIVCSTPCYCCGEKLKGVQFQPLHQRIKNYPGKVFWLKSSLFTSNWAGEGREEEYSMYLKELLHTPYDLLGAFRARDLTILEKLVYRKRDISSLYCSELVAAIYRKFTDKVKKNLVYSPNKLVNEFLKMGLLRKPVRVCKESCYG